MAHTENRNLVVCETFDDFAEKVDGIDFDVEDIVGLVTSLANVFYWLNVESVWGPLGFTWTKTDDYGVFNTTTVPFTIIPKLPDGERIRQLNGTFNNIASDTIDLRRSNWENLYSLNNPWQDKIVKADLTGAKLTYVNNLLYRSKPVEDATDIKGLYIKADFSGVSYLNGNTGYIYLKSELNITFKKGWAFIHIDDENKGLNAPHCNGCALWWSGEGEFKLEYFFREEGLQNYNSGSSICVYSENGKMTLTNVANSRIKLIGNRFDNSTEREASTDFYPRDDETPMELTIDGRINPVIQINGWTTPLAGSYYAATYYMKPIKLVNYDSIDWINPYYLLKDEWPELPEEELEKWEDSKNSSFMPYLMINNLELAMNCPYTIDVSKRQYLNMLNCSVYRGYIAYGYTKEDWIAAGAESVTIDSNTLVIADIFPTITGFDHTLDLITFPSKGLLSTGNRGIVFWKLPNCTMRTKEMASMTGFYMGENTVIECSTFKADWAYTSIIMHDTDTIHWRLFPNDEGKISARSLMSNYGCYVVNATGDMNFIELETHDEAVLKASLINTFCSTKCNYKHDIVICNFPQTVGLSTYDTITIESEFIYLYATNVSITCREGKTSYETVKKLIDGLVKDDSGTAHSVTLNSWIYSQLTDDEKSHIVNDLGYTLVEQK